MAAKSGSERGNRPTGGARNCADPAGAGEPKLLVELARNSV